MLSFIILQISCDFVPLRRIISFEVSLLEFLKDRGGKPVKEKRNQSKPGNWAFSRGSPVGVPS